MALSADFTVNGNSNPARHIVAYGSTVNLALTSLDAGAIIVWSIVASSKSGEALPALTLGGVPTGATSSFEMPADPADGLGRCFLILARVSNQYEVREQYAVVGAANTAGLLPLTPNEQFARDATHGWTEDINEALAGTVANVPLSSLEDIPGNSLVGKPGADGPPEAITLSTNSFARRTTGAIVTTSIGNNQLIGRFGSGNFQGNTVGEGFAVCRPDGGSLGANKVDDSVSAFVSPGTGAYSLRVAPVEEDPPGPIADEGSSTFAIGFPASSSCVATVLVLATDEGGTFYRLLYRFYVDTGSTGIGWPAIFTAHLQEVVINSVPVEDVDAWLADSPPVYIDNAGIFDSVLTLVVPIQNDTGLLINARVFVNVESWTAPAAPVP